jgi:hypothetical protein
MGRLDGAGEVDAAGHLDKTYGIEVTGLVRLDAGVTRAVRATARASPFHDITYTGRHSNYSLDTDSGTSADVFDDLDQFVEAVPVATGELDELLRPLDHGTVLRRADDGDAPSAAELEQALVAEEAQRAQDGVRVDTEHGGEILCRWEPVAGLASPSAIARRSSAATCS